MSVVLLAAGCGSDMVGTPPSSSKPSVSVTATPTSITAGGSSVLTVSAANATAVTVAGSDGSSYTLPAAGGTETVTPSATTTYTATVTATAGTATATATVTVTAVATPTVSISAEPASITASSSATLSVVATNATQVVITGSDGTSYKLPGVGGTQEVNPSATTTYTATAMGASGQATSQVTVIVTPNPVPAVTITAVPASITASNSSTLTVTASNATKVTLTGSDGTSYNLQASGGTEAVSPKTTTMYTATATGAGGTTTKSITVTVTANPAPTVTLSANPPAVVEGSSSTLTITASNATKVVLTGSDGSSQTLPASDSTQSVKPSATTTYTATATGAGGTNSSNVTVTVTSSPTASVTIHADPATIGAGHSSLLTVSASNATQITITGTDGSTYNTVPNSGGTQVVTPASTTTYTVAATGSGGQQTTQNTSVTVVAAGSVDDIDHVIFMLQENHSFDNYFGMLNPYRVADNDNVGTDGVTYNVDGIDDKLTKLSNQDDEGATFYPFKFTSTCIDDESSAWLESYGDVNRYDFSVNRPINMDGFVHTAEGFAKSCQASGTCSGNFTDVTGQRSMGYYDQSVLNYYYFMSSQFALSDRWFSPVSSKSIDNRIATFTGGTTQGLTADPGNDDRLPQLAIPTIFGELTQASASWKVYYTVTQGECTDEDDCPTTANSRYPGTNFSALQQSYTYMHEPSAAEMTNGCTAPTISSNNPITGDTTGSFCVDPTHIAPISQYYVDLNNGSLPDFAFIEAGYGNNDEHPGSGQSVLQGQAEVAKLMQALMGSTEWKDSVFFLSYDEAGGPYDHVPPVPGHSNDNTDASLGTIPDISGIAVNADTYNPCLPPTPGVPTTNCDLTSTEPGANSGDAAAQQGFAAQLGFRVPNMVISPFTREHYVSHIPMDHTAVIKFVENRFIGPDAHLTNRDNAQPNLLNFFNFQTPPWQTPPTPPTPVSDPSGATCTPANFAPSTP